MRGERMPQGMATNPLGDLTLLYRQPHGTLNAGVGEMMTPSNSGPRIDRTVRRRKYPLPAPFQSRVGIFLGQGVRKPNRSDPFPPILFKRFPRQMQLGSQRT